MSKQIILDNRTKITNLLEEWHGSPIPVDVSDKLFEWISQLEGDAYDEGYDQGGGGEDF